MTLRPLIVRCLVLVFLSLSVLALQGIAQPEGTVPVAGPSAVVTVTAPAGNGLLVLPPSCQQGTEAVSPPGDEGTLPPACPLIVVSHRWRGTPEDGVDTVGHAVYAGFLSRFVSAGYAVLLSGDGGPETWGNEAALENTRQLWEASVKLFRYSDETFTMGFSMGGLPAALLGLTGRIPVRGAVLIAPVLSLSSVYASNPTFRASIDRAYPPATPGDFPAASLGHDPVRDGAMLDLQRLPVLVVASPDDQTAPFKTNARAYLDRYGLLEGRSRLLEVTGPHLGGPHFGEPVVRAALGFLSGLRGLPGGQPGG